MITLDAISATFAMYFLDELYQMLHQDVASQRPWIKRLCVKIVLFFSTYQNVSLTLPDEESHSSSTKSSTACNCDFNRFVGAVLCP
jgi:hypothetical protein